MNNKYIWIKDSGLIEEKELIQEALLKISEEALFLAYSTDSFLAGHANEDEIGTLKPENLLELRIFSKEEEFLWRQSRVGDVFQYRHASEKEITRDQYMIHYQTLDINRDRTEKEGNLTDSYGNRILYTTVGGKYKLPIEKNADSSKIISYIDYDKNGMAKIMDYRLCGFVRQAIVKEEDKGGEGI